jgi:hypothetical protein
LKTTTDDGADDTADDRLWTKIKLRIIKMIKNTCKTSSKAFGFNFGTDSWPTKRVENCQFFARQHRL